MKVTAERLEKNLVRLAIELESEAVAAAMQKAYVKVGRSVQIPGFRKGKVPMSILKTRLEPVMVWQEAIDDLLPEALTEVMTKEGFNPISRPSVDLTRDDLGKELSFTATFEVMPEVVLGQYKGLQGVKETKGVGESDVDQVLEDIRQRQAQWVPAGHNQAQDGDQAIIDFVGFMDEVPFPGGAGESVPLVLGSKSYIPGFEDGVIGMEVGETKKVTLTFPEEYPEESFAGEETVFEITLRELKTKEVPAIDDELAKSISDKETLAELRADILVKLKESAEDEAQSALEDSLVSQAVENATFEVGEALVGFKLDEMTEAFKQRLSQQGQTLEEYTERVGKTLEEIRQEWEPQAERQVRISLVLEAIGDAESIEVTDEDVDARLAEIGKRYGQDADFARKVYANRMEDVKGQARIQKIIDFLISQAEIEEKEVSE